MPVNILKPIAWFEDFVRRNKDRLVGIDVSKYVDIHSIQPMHVDYNKWSKSTIIKAKNLEK